MLLIAGLKQLPPAGHQGVQIALVLRAFLGQTRGGPPRELGQDAGVDGVGLGEDAQALGQVPDAAGMDAGHGKARVEAVVEQRRFVAAGRLDDDQRGLQGRQVRQELPATGGRVVDVKNVLRAGGRQVEHVFGDIDPREDAVG